MIRPAKTDNDDLLTIKNDTLRFSDTGITTVGVLFEAHRYEEGMIIEIKHNLPDCFKVYPPDEYSVVNTIIVTYNGLRSCLKRRNEDLSITAHLGNREETKNVKIQVGDYDEQGFLRQEDLCCNICKFEFKTNGLNRPHVLSICGHTLCETCVGLSRSKNDNSFKCALCRKINFVTHPNFTLIEALKEKEMKNEGQFLAQTPLVTGTINSCYENEMHESSVYCTSCEQNYCQYCFANTHSSRIFKDHQKIPIIERPVTLPNCPNHPNYPANMICWDGSKNIIHCHECQKSHQCEKRLTKHALEKNKNCLLEMLSNLKITRDHFSKKVGVIEKYKKQLGKNFYIHIYCLKSISAQQKLKAMKQEKTRKLVGKIEESRRIRESLKSQIKLVEDYLLKRDNLHNIQPIFDQYWPSYPVENLKKYSKPFNFNIKDAA